MEMLLFISYKKFKRNLNVIYSLVYFYVMFVIDQPVLWWVTVVWYLFYLGAGENLENTLTAFKQ